MTLLSKIKDYFTHKVSEELLDAGSMDEVYDLLKNAKSEYFSVRHNDVEKILDKDKTLDFFTSRYFPIGDYYYGKMIITHKTETFLGDTTHTISLSQFYYIKDNSLKKYKDFLIKPTKIIFPRYNQSEYLTSYIPPM